jgi:uncharacterized protein (TIGR00106 family)
MLAEISVMPVGNEESLTKYVVDVINYIENESKKRNLKYRPGPMGTLIEGDSEDVFEVLKGAHNTMANLSNRVYTIIKIDDRKGRLNAMVDKMKGIEARVEKK